ncbi:MAG: ketoacyl-ACP synthase III [Propionibacteriaceae bacterium]|nr:ketoacyl-ACP synthase III [Propionibacteriaceae bacterium]
MVNYARIAGIAGALPEAVESNEMLAQRFPEWSAEKIGQKTGISQRHVAGPEEFVSDLAIRAARALIDQEGLDPESIDHVIVCTQAPDFYMPVSAALVHHALGLRSNCGANDINLGCSGFIYGLGLAKGLIESHQAKKVLLITADTYSKFLNPEDKSVRTIFGDGAAATLVTDGGTEKSLHAFDYGTDGSGATGLIVPRGGLRSGADIDGGEKTMPEARGLAPSRWDLYMDGPAIFNFTLRVVPESLDRILTKAGLEMGDIDLFVLHQANAFMLKHLAKKTGIPADKMHIAMSDSGNTVSSTIPLALEDAAAAGRIQPGMRILLLGFGVGLSWGGLIYQT